MSKTSYYAVHLHLVFSTNRRRRCIKGNVKTYLYEAIRSLITDSGGELRAIGGTTDHVHLLASLPPTTDISKTVQKVKSMTSKWMNEHYFTDDKFRWARVMRFSVLASLWLKKLSGISTRNGRFTKTVRSKKNSSEC